MKRVLLLFAICVAGQVFGQNKITKFTTDSVTFFNEMEQFLTESRREDGRLVMDEFSWDWYGGKFSEEQRMGVYMICNMMLANKKRAFPDFRNYLISVSKFVNSKYQTTESFNNWQDILVELISDKKNKKIFGRYLESCNTLFEENALYKSSANVWKADNFNYEFGFDSLPKIEFKALTLTCYSKGDSSIIKNTKGVYYPTERVWYGEGGKVTWERAGYSPDSLYAEVGEYRIEVKSPTYEMENVVFYDLFHFDKPLKGKLKDKILANVTYDKASYPRFDSYDKRLQIKEIAKEVDYVGGFSQHGRKVVGKGDETQDAYLIFYRKGLPFVKIGSKTFSIRPERIASTMASATIFLKSDSIYHPGLSFKFFVEDRKVAFIRDKQGVKNAPYLNSYHQVDMDFEALYWNLDDPMMEFTNLIGGTKTDALFLSNNYFNKNTYYDVRGMADVNPLYQLKKMTIINDTNYLTMKEVANYMRLAYDQTITLLLNLSYSGFVQYNYDEQDLIVLDKCINWVKASAGKVDYDVIGFYSKIKGASNGTLSLINYDLQLRGVNSVHMSDSQEVTIYPDKRELTLKKNRDFDFDGVIQAGRFDIMGSDFSFKYDEFKVEMPNVDSLRIYAETGEMDDLGRPIIKPVKTVINQIVGDLLIDHPTNKSGIKQIAKYPVLNSFEDSYVFYDSKSIQGGQYQKDDFYFHVKPFTIDSLDNFTNKSLQFDGTFKSAGIFPDFEEKLTLQPDHSLGFVRKTPPEGYPMYGDKGTFKNEIQMSHEGLKGDGKLEYIASTTYSNEFIFLPDSAHAIAQNFDIEESPVEVEFPPVEGNNVKMVWQPKKDFMTHEEIDAPIKMYDMKSIMHGLTRIQPDGLYGTGVFEFEKAELESKEINFKFKDFNSDTADFRLKDAGSTEEGALAFATTNVNAYVSFAERYGHFKSNGGGSYIDFPQNQYICFMDEFKWFMDNDDIEMSAGEREATDASGVKLDGAQFISVHPEQDSLSFFSTKARYDLKNKIIDAKGVKFINVADAMIYPDSSQLVVEKKAKIRTLHNAKVVASFITQNHNLYNATLDIFGKRKYAGDAFVDYVDELDQAQTIHFEELSVDTTGQTYGKGEIPDSSAFKLSPHYEFKGKVELFANNEYLTFDGQGRIGHECDKLPKNWFGFRTIVDPLNIYIPIDSNTVDENGNRLFASVMLSADSLGVYSTYLNNKKKYSHTEVINAEGFLFYDKETSEYKISNKDKLQEMSFSGNYLSLNTDNCKVYGEGKIDIGADLGQVLVNSAGTVTHNQIDNEAIFDLTMLVNFFFTDEGLKKMAKQMQENTSLDPVKIDRPVFEKGLREVIGKTEADKLIAQANLYGEFKKLPDELRQTIVFNDVKFKWDDKNRRYKSFGKLGISNIGKEQVNKYMDGKVEIIKKRSGDVLTIYLEMDKNNWYFFTYTRGMMQAISSNEEFNTAIKDTKPDKRKSKGLKSQGPYQFMYSTDRKKKDFLRKFDD